MILYFECGMNKNALLQTVFWWFCALGYINWYNILYINRLIHVSKKNGSSYKKMISKINIIISVIIKYVQHKHNKTLYFIFIASTRSARFFLYIMIICLAWFLRGCFIYNHIYEMAMSNWDLVHLLIDYDSRFCQNFKIFGHHKQNNRHQRK